MGGNYGRLGKVRENSDLNKETINIDSNIRQEIYKEFPEWARNIWGIHPHKQKTWDEGQFFEAFFKLQLHLEMYTRICQGCEVVIARSNNGKANYNKSLLNFGANKRGTQKLTHTNITMQII